MAKKLSQIPALAAVAGGNRIKFDTLVGKEITITGVSWEEGDFGDYALIEYTEGASKDKHQTACGAEQVVAILKAAEEEDSFPFSCTPRSFPSKKFKGKSAYSLE
jgi:hypothetical protein